MSMHSIPLTQLELDGLTAHGLDVGAPSQLSDAFLQGVAYVLAAQSKKGIVRLSEEMDRKSSLFEDYTHRSIYQRGWLDAQAAVKSVERWVGLSDGDAIAIADGVVRGNFVHTERNIALRAAYETESVLMGKNK